MEREIRLDELAERTGVPRRTIRLYITRGLIPGPRRAGPNAAYGPEHVKALEAIRRMQKRGLTLARIRRELAARDEAPVLPEPAPWLAYALADDVTVTVRAGVPPWRLRQIHEAMARFSHAITEEERKLEHDTGND